MFHLIMYQEPIFLEPVFQERIWGGEKLNKLFGYEIPTDKTGEAWVISAHKNGPSTIKNGPLKGRNLLDVWHEHPSLFGKVTPDRDFPLLVKILDANDDLSVQVHPNDEYAWKIEDGQYGKTECWYVLDCEQDSEIIFGHRATSRDDFKQRIDAEEWDELLIKIKVKKGDFFYVPSGTIHAIGKGIVILEIQQSSDITYRVYDYNRRDEKGNQRELHIQSAIDVTNYPHSSKFSKKIERTIGDLKTTRLMKAKYFTVYHWELCGKTTTPLQADYLVLSVISGEGEITINDRTFSIKKGTHFILPAMIAEYEIEGDIEIVVSIE